jgi:UPF0755 protein
MPVLSSAGGSNSAAKHHFAIFAPHSPGISNSCGWAGSIADEAACQSGQAAVSGSIPPSSDSERDAASSRPAAQRLPTNSEQKAGTTNVAPIQSALLQRPRWSSAASDNPLKAAAERLTNGSAAKTAVARGSAEPPAARRTASADAASGGASTPPARAAMDAREPYPPLSGRMVNGIGTASVPPKRGEAARLAPRSPRTAIEPDAVEPPSRGSRTARHPLVIIGNAIITAIVLAAIVAAAVLFVGRQSFDAPGPLAEDRVVNIPHGSGIRDIADVLQREGVIDQPWVFIGGVFVLKAREDLKAGEYQFKAHASLRDVVETIVEGRVVTHQISVPEGLTSEQIVARLLDDDVLTGNIAEIPREGSLLPDTYNFSRGITREQLIQRMQQSEQRLVKDIWDHRSADLTIKTPDQLVILASLIEKETGKPEERTRVAAVFVNRLKQKMKLQSDPTIIYGLVGGKGTLGRPIMKSEIDQATPYNTYQIDGLPPGPICNPGRASLEAAANPARTREIYFVADGTGGHVFAETYEQHQKNVARLRLIQTDQKDQAPIDATAPPSTTQTNDAPVDPTAAAPARTRHTSARRKQAPQ